MGAGGCLRGERQGWHQLALSVFVTGLATAIGILMPNVLVPIGVTGSTTAVAIMYCFPAYFYIRVRKLEGSTRREWCAWALLVGGVAVGALATVVSVMPPAKTPSVCPSLH